jgi:16S rRNA (cytosine967-C5)-methyltransferase
MNEQFDQIICDVPCSGSGTWSHSPEQFYFFDAKQLKNYVQRQALILRHVWKALKPGGNLIYLTCSILSAENEMQIAQFRQEYECELEQQKVLFHQPYGGDGMYIAVLRKPDQEVLI